MVASVISSGFILKSYSGQRQGRRRLQGKLSIFHSSTCSIDCSVSFLGNYWQHLRIPQVTNMFIQFHLNKTQPEFLGSIVCPRTATIKWDPQLYLYQVSTQKTFKWGRSTQSRNDLQGIFNYCLFGKTTNESTYQSDPYFLWFFSITEVEVVGIIQWIILYSTYFRIR